MGLMLNRMHTFWNAYTQVILIFVATRFLIFLITGSVYVSAHLEPSAEGLVLSRGMSLTSVPLKMWERWDSQHYIEIATTGYTLTLNRALNTAYFPLYPLAGRLLNWLIPDVRLCLLLVSYIAFFVAVVLLYKLALLDFDPATALRAVVYVSVYPFTVFFSGIFTESLFLMLLVATMYFARTQQWFRAGFSGMFLTATRLLGMAAAPALTWEYCHQRRWDLRKIDRSALALLVVPLGLLAFMVYTYIAHDDFLSTFHSTRQIWGGKPSWPWVSFQNQIGRLGIPQLVPTAAFELLFALFAIGVLIGCFKYLRMSYALVAAVLVLVSFSNVSLQSFCRYLTTVFPMYLLLAQAGRRNGVHALIMIVSVAGMLFFTALFANGRFIG
ncbi:MAG: mannosyltransferase family protein [Bacteroidota bacterium]